MLSAIPIPNSVISFSSVADQGETMDFSPVLRIVNVIPIGVLILLVFVPQNSKKEIHAQPTSPVFRASVLPLPVLAFVLLRPAAATVTVLPMNGVTKITVRIFVVRREEMDSSPVLRISNVNRDVVWILLVYVQHYSEKEIRAQPTSRVFRTFVLPLLVSVFVARGPATATVTVLRMNGVTKITVRIFVARRDQMVSFPALRISNVNRDVVLILVVYATGSKIKENVVSLKRNVNLTDVDGSNVNKKGLSLFL